MPKGLRARFDEATDQPETRKVTARSADATLALADCGTVQLVVKDGKVLTLPATAAGMSFTVENGAPDGTSIITISPNASDKISGAGLTPADNKDLINTKATAKKGDRVTLHADAVDGWVVTEMIGTWAREG